MLIAVKSLVNTGGRDNPRGNPVVYCSLKHTILGTLLFSFGTIVSTISKNNGQKKKPGLLFCYFFFNDNRFNSLEVNRKFQKRS